MSQDEQTRHLELTIDRLDKLAGLFKFIVGGTFAVAAWATAQQLTLYDHGKRIDRHDMQIESVGKDISLLERKTDVLEAKQASKTAATASSP